MPIPGLAARRFTSTAIDIVEQMCPRAAERGMATGCTRADGPQAALWSLLRWERKSGWSHWSGWGSRSTRWPAMRTGGCLRRVRKPGQPIEPAESQALSAGRRVVVDFDTPLRPLLAAAEDESPVWVTIGSGPNTCCWPSSGSRAPSSGNC